jgi:acid phosphatase type 7
MRKLFLAVLLLALIFKVIGGTRFYRASYRDDPSTTIVIGWCDNGISTNAKVYYDVVDYDTIHASYAFNHAVDRTQSLYSMNHRFARLTGLAPNTVYYFIVHDDQGNSARMNFKTLPNKPDSGITFITGGDSRTGSSSDPGYLQCRPNRQACDSLVAKIRPDFVAFCGDYVLIPNNSLWSDWFTDWQFTLGAEGHLIPLIPVMGNHEASQDVYNLFDVPNSNAYYSLGIAGNLIRIYCLNTDLAGCDAAQKTWLTNDLQLYTGTLNEPYWKFVQYHVPFVAHTRYGLNTTLVNCWGPLFEKYKVNLASEGHAHDIKITWPILMSTGTGSDHNFIRNDSLGIIYIGEGSWGAPQHAPYTYYNSDLAYSWTRNQAMMAGFQLICVTKEKIEIRTVQAVNAKNVGQVQLLDPPCTLPDNLPLWNPSNGSIATINYKDSVFTGVFNKKKENQKLCAYPVPSNDMVTISFKKLTEDGQMEIYNGLGAKMKSIPVASGTVSKEINFSQFPVGTYNVFIRTKTGIQACRILHLH